MTTKIEAPAGWTAIASPESVAYPGADAALHAVLSALYRHRVVLLVGPPGVGKTTLLARVVESLQRSARAVTVWRPPNASASRSAIVVVDDADKLPQSTLRELARRRAGCVLAACRPPLLLTRRTSVVIVTAISESDIVVLLASVAGSASRTKCSFSASVTNAIMRHGDGKPGVILDIARTALFLARMEGSDVVDAGHVERAAVLGEGTKDDESRAREEAHHDVPLPGSPSGARRSGRIALVAACGVGLSVVPWDFDRYFRYGVLHNRHQVAPADPPSAMLAAPRPPLPDPAASLLHVTILADLTNIETRAQAETVAEVLAAHGIADVTLQSASARNGSSSLSYFFADDSGAAQSIFAILGDAFSEPRLVMARGLPRPGTIEVSIAPDARPPRRNGHG